MMAPMLGRQYAKLCDVRDFTDSGFLEAARSILPERRPEDHVERKVWEQCQIAMFLKETGHLREGARILAVGAGDERLAFWLANRCGHVLATDLYGETSFAGREARATMLTDPAAHAPFEYRADRLEVARMDARALDLPDASFDAVYSMSSIEHFGGPKDVVAAAREMGRVVRSGGHVAVVTECFVRRHPLNAAPVDFAVRAGTLGLKRRRATPRRRGIVSEVFTARELCKRIVEPSGCELMQPLDLSLSAASWENLTVTRGCGGALEPLTGAHYPHVLLQADRSVFTSVLLPLRRPQ